MILKKLSRLHKRPPVTRTAVRSPEDDAALPFFFRLLRLIAYGIEGLSLKTRLVLITSFTVIFAIAVITGAAYTTVSQGLYQELDKNLHTQAQGYIDSGYEFPASQTGEGENYTPEFLDTTGGLGVLIVPAEEAGEGKHTAEFEEILAPQQMAVVEGHDPYSFSTEGDFRTFAVRADDGRVIVLKQDMTFTSMTLEALQLILLLIAITGFLGAIVTGITVATSGLQPINRLRRAADNVTRTGQLKQIPVYTTDELGALTQSFNNMMSALQEAQTKQKRLVADASHELKTPLTSLRTNIELLMLASKNKNVGISDKDREDIERDVIAQIEEMSTLIGDLVDLAREDEQPAVLTTFDVEDTLGECIDRVQRRRPDVTFSSSLERWVVDGDPFALSRALLNLLDNAAKWSPKGGVVRVAMFPADAERMCIEVQDSGPGIPEEDRPKIFDRFYRSISSRSMPGSGLGLAIVKQVVERHGGTVEVGESDDGGTRMTVTLPGGDQS